MPHLPAPRPHRAAAAGITLALALALAACGDLVAALPPRPSPFPTLARLPSVTPVTPSPTPPPTATAPLATATPEPLLVRAPGAANVRSGPGVDFAIVGVVAADDPIALVGRAGDWYRVTLADGSTGWMAGQVLAVDPAIAVAVPLVEP